VSEMQTIDIDCPPGHPRPGDLIGGVIDGLGIADRAEPPIDQVTPFFGNACYSFRVPDDEWKRIQPVLKERLVALYEAGIARYCSW